ncbi:sensor domain-containing diguanylate cyclase [bacterium]|nr:MAG: sensor domain-containing diguanylate cyclase [bacterium]
MRRGCHRRTASPMPSRHSEFLRGCRLHSSRDRTPRGGASLKVQLCAAADAGREPVAAWILDGGHQLAAGGEPADVAVADVAMGPATAIAACSEAAIPVLAINARDDDVAALIAAGVHDLLPPPVTRARLLARLALFANRQQAGTGSGSLDALACRAVLDAAPDAIFVMEAGADGRWRLGYANLAYRALVRQRDGQIVGKTARGFLPPAAARNVTRRCREAVETGCTIEYQEELDFSSRRTVLQTSLTPLFDASGRCRRLVGATRDITGSRVAEEILHANEERLHAIVEAAGDGIVVIDGAGAVESFNPAAEQMFGFEAIEVLGTKAALLLPAAFGEGNAGTFADSLAAGMPRITGLRRETVARRRDGTAFPVEMTLSEMWVAGERKFTGTLRDVTERKLAEERFQTLAERAPIGIYIAQDGAFQYVNPCFTQFTGYSADEVLGTNPLELVIPEERELVRESAVRMLKGQATGTYEYRIRTSAGEVRWVMENLVSLDYRGKRAAYGYYVDITGRKAAEAALRESEERYRTTFQQLRDVFYKTDEDGVITMVSPSVQRLLGYGPEELLGTNAGAIFASADAALAMLARVLHGESLEDFETDLRRKDGSPVTVALTASLVFGEGADRIAIQGTVRDITERKRAEAERDRYFELSTDMLAVTDLEARFVRLNPAWERVLGYPKEKMLGRTVMRFAHPDYRQKVIDDALKTLDGEALSDVRTMFLTAGGEARWLSWSTSPVIGGEAYSVVRDVTGLVRAEEEQAAMLRLLEEHTRVLTEQAAELDTLRAEAEYAANHDMLTGLLNRRAWFNVALAQRGKAVALFDIDHFKRINDTWGHPAGDAVLAEVSLRLEGALREATLGRVGGEEFAIQFACSLDAARIMCEEALAAVAAAPISLPGGEEVMVTMSAGLAPWRLGRYTREDALAQVYEEADAALYTAKQAGRARLVVAPHLRVA